MNRLMLVCLLSLLPYGSTLGQWSDTPQEPPSSLSPTFSHTKIGRLAKRLCQNASSEQDKVSQFYDWLTHRVAYDVKRFQRHQTNVQALTKTLSRRKGLCRDYAAVFDALCQEAGIASFTVVGYAKGHGYCPGDTFFKAEHAWNAVRIDSQWHLLDATWGSGYLTKNRKTRLVFVRNPTKDWFLTAPTSMCHNHLPVDPCWQLLEQPVPMRIF